MTRLAKLSQPRMQGVHPRTRLFRRLDHALERPVVWITGFPGAGKTTLAASYLEHRRLRGYWYHLDGGDSDVGTFFHYLGLAIPGVGRRRPLPTFTPEHVGGLAAFSRGFFRALLARARPPFALVFDDYQELAPGSDVHGALAEALEELPAGASAVLVGRCEPPPDFARLRANGAMEVIPAEELRLTLAESRALASLRAPRGSPADPVSLHEKSAGWAAGLVLMLEGAGAACAAHPAGEPDTQSLFDYFASEILGRADHESRRILLDAAVMTSIGARMAARLTGVPHAGRLLADLARRGYFVVHHPGPDPLFEFHPLFARFLRARAAEAGHGVRLRDLKRRAAALLLEEGRRTDEALDLLCEAESWEETSAALLDHAPGLIAAGRARALARWLLPIPDRILAARPWLLYWLAVARLPFDPPEARRHFERALAAMDEADDPSGLFSAWCGIVESFLVEWGDFTGLDRWIDTLAGLRRRHPRFPNEQVETRVTYAMFAALVHRRPDHPDLAEWRNRLERLADGADDVRLRMGAANLLVQHAIWTGHLDRAGAIAERARPRLDGQDPFTEIHWHATQALQQWIRGSFEPSRSSAEEGLRLSRQSGVHCWDAILYSQLAQACIAFRHLDEAGRHLQAMRGALPPGHPLEALWGFAMTALLLARGEDEAALRQATAAEAMSRRAGMPFGLAFNTVVLGMALLRQGSHRQAAAALAEARAMASRLGSKLIDYLAAIALARAAFLGGDQRTATAALADGLATGREIRFMGLGLWFGPEECSEICALALSRGIEVDHVRALVRFARLGAPEAARHLESWPWALRVRALGGFELWRDGAAVPIPPRLRRPLELLQAIVAHGGSEVRQETLEEALWPDADGDLARHALEMALCRVRKLLGDQEVLRVASGTVGFDPRLCWVDAQAFERLATRSIFALQKASPPPEVVSEAERALAQYRGPFLGNGSVAPWAVAYRDRLERKRRVLAEELAPRRSCAVPPRQDPSPRGDDAAIPLGLAEAAR